jgi:hypothetical protein
MNLLDWREEKKDKVLISHEKHFLATCDRRHLGRWKICESARESQKLL